MANPIKLCVICGEEFELLPNKPGLINQCPECVKPKGPDPRLVGNAHRADKIATVEAQVAEAIMNGDPHEVKIAKNRLDKAKARNIF